LKKNEYKLQIIEKEFQRAQKFESTLQKQEDEARRRVQLQRIENIQEQNKRERLFWKKRHLSLRNDIVVITKESTMGGLALGRRRAPPPRGNGSHSKTNTEMQKKKIN